MTTNTYLMTPKVLARFSRQGRLSCSRCGIIIKLGDHVTSKSSRDLTGKTRLYHTKCMEAMYHK